MKFSIFNVFILNCFLLLFSACSLFNSNKQTEIINKDTFAKVLTDMHFADGVIRQQGLDKRVDANVDTVSKYNYIFVKYKISRSDFDKTILYYTQNTNEFKDIYDQVILNLNNKIPEIQIEQDKEQQKLKEKNDFSKSKDNIWNQKRTWKLPEDGETNPISINITTSQNGLYKLTAEIVFFEDDGSVNPGVTLIANYSDGTNTVCKTTSILKDGVTRKIELILETDKKKQIVSLTGWILDHSTVVGKEHINVNNIELVYKKNIN